MSSMPPLGAAMREQWAVGKPSHGEITAEEQHAYDEREGRDDEQSGTPPGRVLRQRRNAEHGGRMDHEKCRGRLEELTTAEMRAGGPQLRLPWLPTAQPPQR
jgi:hypothetical protein